MNLGKKSLMALAAFTMAGAPISAQAASSLSVSSIRAGAETEDANQLGGGHLIPILAVIAVVVGIILITDGDDSPTSP